jgi:hypothetical protein
MIKALRERFPVLTIIVRPHPSENHEKWCEVLPELRKLSLNMKAMCCLAHVLRL